MDMICKIDGNGNIVDVQIPDVLSTKVSFVSMEADSDYYVYLHRSVRNDKLFYVGKGRKYRAWSREGRSNDWLYRAEWGFEVIIVRMNMYEKDALELEAKMIKWLHALGQPLVNRFGITERTK